MKFHRKPAVKSPNIKHYTRNDQIKQPPRHKTLQKSITNPLFQIPPRNMQPRTSTTGNIKAQLKSLPQNLYRFKS